MAAKKFSSPARTNRSVGNWKYNTRSPIFTTFGFLDRVLHAAFGTMAFPIKRSGATAQLFLREPRVIRLNEGQIQVPVLWEQSLQEALSIAGD